MDLHIFKDSSLIDKVAYRGDTRSPEVIFREGFWNKQTPDYVWRQMFLEQHEVPGLKLKTDIEKQLKKKTLSESDFDDQSQIMIPPLVPKVDRYQVRLKNNPQKVVNIWSKQPNPWGELSRRYFDNPVQYRDQQYQSTTGKTAQYDINPNSAVCLTLEADVAPYFPIDGTDDNGGWCWIYAVRLYAGIKTYRLQRKDRPEMAFAREVAVERVPYTHVLCAVRCWRIGKFPDMQFNFLPRIWWNPRASSFELARSRNKIIRDISPLQAHRVQCPTHTSQRVIYGRELILEGRNSRAEAWT